MARRPVLPAPQRQVLLMASATKPAGVRLGLTSQDGSPEHENKGTYYLLVIMLTISGPVMLVLDQQRTFLKESEDDREPMASGRELQSARCGHAEDRRLRQPPSACRATRRVNAAAHVTFP